MPVGTQASLFAWVKPWANKRQTRLKNGAKWLRFLLSVQALADDLKHITGQIRRGKDRFQRRFHMRL